MATISLVMVVVFVGICLNERQQNFQEVQSSLGGAIYKAAETDRKAKAQAESGPQDGAEESQAAQQGLIDASSSDPLNRENPQAASEEAGGMVLGRGEESPAIPVAVYRLSQDGSLTAAFPEQSIISVDESTIESAAQTIAQAADGTDVLSDYGLVYMKRSMKDGTYVTFADASHELKTPLTVILANSSILEKHPETPLRENMQWLESTREETVRMQELVSDMLSLAQAESTETYEFARTNLSSIVSKEALQFESVAFERNATIEDDIAEGMHVQGSTARWKSSSAR